MSKKSPAKVAPAPIPTGEFNIIRYADGLATPLDDSTRHSRHEAQRLLTAMCNAYRACGWNVTGGNLDVMTFQSDDVVDVLRVSAVMS